MKKSRKKTKKLDLDKSTLKVLALKSHIQAGTVGNVTSICSNYCNTAASCHTVGDCSGACY